MVTGPDVRALVVAQRSHQPSGQGQQGSGVQDGMVNRDLVTLQDAGQNLAAEGKAIGAVQFPAPLLLDIGDELGCLVVNRGEGGLYAQREPVHLHGDDAEAVFQELDERQK